MRSKQPGKDAKPPKTKSPRKDQGKPRAAGARPAAGRPARGTAKPKTSHTVINPAADWPFPGTFAQDEERDKGFMPKMAKVLQHQADRAINPPHFKPDFNNGLPARFRTKDPN